MKVAICVPTFRRPVGLARLLASLEKLRLPYGVDPLLVVVDNDGHGSARATVDAASLAQAWPVRFAVEPRRGVSFVRNALLDLTADCDLIAFIDDDEAADPDWLAELMDRQRATGAAAVTGPTLPLFSGPVPAWLGTAFALCYIRPRADRPLREVTTSNLLLDREVVTRLNLRFDEELSMIGGEDTLLAFDLVRHRQAIVWAERALTYEYIPESRARLGWLLRRWYRTGNIEALLAMRGRAGPTGRMVGLLGGLARLGVGTAELMLVLPACLAGSRGRALKRLYTVARGAGMLASVCGRRHQEYATTHGA